MVLSSALIKKSAAEVVYTQQTGRGIRWASGSGGSTEQTTRQQLQDQCDHKTGLGYSATIKVRTPDGEERQVCSRCNKTWYTSSPVQAVDILNDATPSEPESPLDGTSSPGVAGTSGDGTALTATGIRRAVDFMSGKNVTLVDLPVRTGNPIQFLSQPVGYRTSLGVSSPDPKNDPIKDPMTEGEAGFQEWLLKKNSTLGKIKGWVGKRLAKRKKHSQSKSLLKELLRIKAEVESRPCINNTTGHPIGCGCVSNPNNLSIAPIPCRAPSRPLPDLPPIP